MLEIERRGHSVRALANWILDYADELGFLHTNMGVNKLTFFALEDFLVKKGALLTNAKVEAWEHGPVFRELYQSFKQYGNGYVTGRAKHFCPASEDFRQAVASFIEEDEVFLRATLQPLMSFSAAELRDLSHRQDGAWYKVWWYDGHVNPGMEISPSLLIKAHKEKQR